MIAHSTCLLVSVVFTSAAWDGPTVRVGGETRAVQAAVDQLAQRGGGTVHVAAGRYLLRDTLQLRGGVRIVGVPNQTIFVVGQGRKTTLARDVAKGAREITLTDATGFDVGDGIALEESGRTRFRGDDCHPRRAC